MKEPTVGELLITIGREATLFHTPDGTAYATVAVGEHEETWALRSTGYRSWLAGQLWQRAGKVARAQSLSDTLTLLEAVARFEGPEEPVYLRLAVTAGATYLDLGDAGWRAVEITPAGWRIVARPSVRFRRPKGLNALPEPRPGGHLDALRPFLNLDGADNDPWLLVVGFLVGLFGRGPYPVLVLGGEQGAAKTTASRILRGLVDPATSPDRGLPRDERDLAIAAHNAHVVSFDNLSRLPEWLSDALARLATGAGFGTRSLYTDAEEALFYAARPVILNGIGELAVRSDLLDRSLVVSLPRIAEERRRPEHELWAAFEAERSAILGGLLDAVSGALARHRDLRLPRLPRMADFAGWVSAAEPALGWPAGTFLAAYERNRRGAHDLALDAASISGPIKQLVSEQGWQGPATALLARLAERADDALLRRRDWPGAPNALAVQLRRLAPDFRAIGIEIDCEAREPGSGARSISIRRLPVHGIVTTVTPVTPSAPPAADADDRDDRDDHLRLPTVRRQPGHAGADPADETARMPAAGERPIEEDWPRSAWGAEE